MNRGVCLAVRTHEGDAATGKANGRGAAREIMEPARVREGMDEDDGFTHPSVAELTKKLLGKSRQEIPVIGRVHKNSAMPFSVEGVLHLCKIAICLDSLLRNFRGGGIEVDAAEHGAHALQIFRRRIPFDFARVERDGRVPVALTKGARLLFGGSKGGGEDTGIQELPPAMEDAPVGQAVSSRDR